MTKVSELVGGRASSRASIDKFYFSDFRNQFGEWASTQFLPKKVNVLARRYFCPFTARCLTAAIEWGNKNQTSAANVFNQAKVYFETFEAQDSEYVHNYRCSECMCIQDEPHAPGCEHAPRWPALKVFHVSGRTGGVIHHGD